MRSNIFRSKALRQRAVTPNWRRRLASWETLEDRRLLAVDAYEPNDTFATAADIGTGPFFDDCLELDDSTDEDWFEWTATQDGTLEVEILFTSTITSDLDLFVHDSTNSEIDSSESFTDNEFVSVDVEGGQSYFIRVHAGGISSGEYTLNITEVFPDAEEPNDTQGTAVDLGSTEPSINNLTIHDSSDEDWFKFTAPSDGDLVIDAMFLHDEGDVDIFLFDPVLTLIDSSQSSTDNEHVIASLSDGDMVFLKVAGDSGDYSPNYSLDFSFSDSPDISPISNQIGFMNTTKVVEFMIDDADTPLNQMNLSAVSSNPFILPPGNISFDTSGANPKISMTPGLDWFGDVDVTITAEDGDGNTDMETFQFKVLPFEPETGPTVNAVRVDSTNWTQAFRDEADAALGGGNGLGYIIPDGNDPGDQLDALPWENVDRIHVTFSENVVVNQNDLGLYGVNTADYTGQVSGFSYNAGNFTATWTLSSAIDTDKLLLALDDSIEDLSGNALDGDWSTGDSFSSGDGTAGGDFEFRFNVLPGDSNQNGIVLGDDVGQVRLNQFAAIGAGNYSIFIDNDGSGIVLGNDVGTSRLNQFDALPGGEPSAPAMAAAMGSATDVDAVMGGLLEQAVPSSSLEESLLLEEPASTDTSDDAEPLAPVIEDVAALQPQPLTAESSHSETFAGLGEEAGDVDGSDPLSTVFV